MGKAVFYKPDLFGTAISLSPALIKQFYPTMSDDVHPNGHADFWALPPHGQGLIQAEPYGRKGRFWLNANDGDKGTPLSCMDPDARPSPGPGGYLNGSFLI